MADGFAKLDSMIARLSTLGPQTVRAAAPKVAKVLERELVAQIGRGQGPDGKAWAPTKDGRTALRNAASALSVNAVGNAVVARLEGPEALHHKGAVRGGVRRQILPTTKLSGPAAVAVREVIAAELRAAVTGAR